MDVAAVVAGFRTRTLPKPEWTHEAHLAVCWETVGRLDVATAIDDLRAAICAYNTSVGTANTPTSGYHETLTRYYVGAVAHLGATSFTDVLAAPGSSRSAPLVHWTRAHLYSTEARLSWVEPDLAPLPFRLP